MDDAELDRNIRITKSQQSFTRLSVQILEITSQRLDSFIASSLEGYQEHVPEPEPNPNKFTGYIKYNKEGYVHAYETVKPLRDLSRLIRTFLPSMQSINESLQTRFQLLTEQRELRLLRRRLRAQLELNQPLNPNDLGLPDARNNGELENNENEPPPLENVDPDEDEPCHHEY